MTSFEKPPNGGAQTKISPSIEVPQIDHASPEWRCAICHVACTQQCSLCKDVAYCGKPHQRDDWQSHRLCCRGNVPTTEGKCKIIYDYDSKGVRRGRKLIASKSIQQGELVLKEKPLVWVPKHDVWPQPTYKTDGTLQQDPDEITDNGPSACIVCGNVIRTAPSVENETKTTCSLCHWPVCSVACEQSLEHQSECKVFQGNNIPRHIQQLLPNRFLFVLRCLLLPSDDPKKWRQLMELEYNPEEMTKKYSPEDMFSENEDDDDQDNNKKRPATTAQSNAKYDKGITKLLKYYGVKCELEWVTHLIKVIRWNVTYDYEYDTKAMLFHLISASKHSCLPNVEVLYKKTDGSAYIRALVDIKPGDPILVSRDPLALMLTAQIRQRRLKYMSGWEGFRCNCARCSDWSELSTNFATLQCRKDLENWGSNAIVTEPSPCKGILTASRPLDQNFEWKCSVCKFKVTGDLNEDKLGMRNLISQVFHFADADASYIDDGIKTVESFQYWFHPNHSFLFQTKMRIMDTINLLCIQTVKANDEEIYKENKLENMEIDGFNDLEKIKKMVQYGTECLKISNAIFPGLSRIRGHILLFLGWGKWTLYKMSKKQENQTGEVDFVQYSESHLIQEGATHLKEAQRILAFYKDINDDERLMAKFAYNLRLKINNNLKVK